MPAQAMEGQVAKGYWMFHVSIGDAETYNAYVAQYDVGAFAEHGARFLARGGRYEAVEGVARSRHIIIEFDSYEAALACYRSHKYQVASRLRWKSAETDLVIVEGVD
jgi:uncharacterized protein (DUF1330 family)